MPPDDTSNPSITPSAQDPQAAEINPATNQPLTNSAQSAGQTGQTPNGKSKMKLILAAVAAIVILLLVSAGAYYFVLNKKSGKATSSTGQNSLSGETVFYSSPDQGYGFNYLKSWKVDKGGSLTVLADPSSPNKGQCAAKIANLPACNVVVSTLPYQGSLSTAPGVTIKAPATVPNDQQVKNLAVQIATDQKTDPITIGNLSGYTALTTNSQGSTLNILLQGNKNMLLIQFPNIASRSALSDGENIVLNSLVEL